jgi:hypothetical protein
LWQPAVVVEVVGRTVVLDELPVWPVGAARREAGRGADGGDGSGRGAAGGKDRGEGRSAWKGRRGSRGAAAELGRGGGSEQCARAGELGILASRRPRQEILGARREKVGRARSRSEKSTSARALFAVVVFARLCS